MYYQSIYPSAIGNLTLVSDGEYLLEVRFAKERHPSSLNDEQMIIKDDLVVFQQTREWLDSYFEGKRPNIGDLPIRLIGTTFRKQVWSLLMEIPYGTVVTYKDLARKISPTMAAQAVGVAVGYNPIGIIIPCHRVIGANHNLVGFGGGLDTKKWLLQHEGMDMTKMITPTKGTAL